uniref:Uncharacterized protein n=1 Tax=Clastoptera arizonana TaxID=38151 RepID=A0A1B6EGY0_9HEMI
MQHIKLMGGKGDPLCPLGFHPQVRWPTRCKRCFRDYKEHGNKCKDSESSLRRDETTLSSPSLSSWTSRTRDETKTESSSPRAWTSSSNLNSDSNNTAHKKESEDIGYSSRFSSTASSWTSSPNLANMKEETVSVTLPRPRPKPIDTGQDITETRDDLAQNDYRRTQYTVRRRTTSSSNLTLPADTSRSSTNSYSSIRDRVRTSPAPSSPTSKTASKSIEVDYTLSLRTSPGKPPLAPRNTTPSRSLPVPPTTGSSSSSGSASSSEEDDESIAGTSTTATIINESELQEQIDNLKKELETTKARCEKVEREKSDILLRRLTTVDTYSSSRPTASEVLKLQQRVNELQSTVEDLRDDKKSLTLKVRELEEDLEKSKKLETLEKEADNLRNKLQAAETLCEELMDENEDMKKELRDLEDEIDEMQDNFREDQADEYSSLKKELEQTAKNCRILSFKLRKSERKSEALEAEKLEIEKKCREIAGGQSGLDKNERIRHLEQELGVANELSQRLQKELEETTSKMKSKDSKADDKTPTTKKKAPMLGTIGKSSSGEKISRESLTRGGSQEDPVQLLRDLQDSLEREADLREQLRYAEEEILKLQLKKKEKMFVESLLMQDIIPKHSEEDSTSTFTQTISTILTSMPSQVKSSQTQTESYVNHKTQTVKLFMKDTFMQTNERSNSNTQTDSVVKKDESTIIVCDWSTSNGTQTNTVLTKNVFVETENNNDTELCDSFIQTIIGLVQKCDFQSQTDPISKSISVQSENTTVCGFEVTRETQTDIQSHGMSNKPLASNEPYISTSTESELTNNYPELQSLQISTNHYREQSTDGRKSKISTSDIKSDIQNKPVKDTTTKIIEHSSTPQVVFNENINTNDRYCRRTSGVLYSTKSLPLNLNILSSVQTQTDSIPASLLPTRTFQLFGSILPHVYNSPLVTLFSPLARKTSPTPSRLTPEPLEKDEGISDEEDPAELRLLLELNEQEAAVLRRKVEELEGEGHNLKAKVKDLQDKLTAKTSLASKRAIIKDSTPTESNALYEKKIKILEEEMQELRKKLVEKERDCERLHAELTVAQKKPKALSKSKSLDGDQQTVDLKRQLQVVEQEASVLRSRNQNLESENEKLVSENKKLLLTQGTKKTAQDRANNLDSKLRVGDLEKKLEEANQKLIEYEAGQKTKSDTAILQKNSLVEIEKLKTQMKKLESEKTKLNDSLRMLKEEAVADILQFYSKRTPKKPTDITTKLQMKKMVEELENEIGEVLVALRKSETERKQLTEIENKKDSGLKFKNELEDFKKKLEYSQKQFNDDKSLWEKEKEKMMKELKNTEKGISKTTKDEIFALNQKIETLNLNLREEKKNSDCIYKELESVKKYVQEKDLEVKEKSDKLSEYEKKLKETEDKLKKNERLNNVKKDKITKLEKELEELKSTLKKSSEKWNDEKEQLNSEVNEVKSKSKKLETELEKEKSNVNQLEANIREERERATDLSLKAGSAASREIKELREELTSTKSKHTEISDELKKIKQDKNISEKTWKERETTLDKELKQQEKKLSELKSDLEAEKSVIAKLNISHEKEMKNKDQEIKNLKTKLEETGGKKFADIKDLESKITRLEQALSSEKREYVELTTKYEQLEEEHVVTKAKLVMDRENIQAQAIASQKELVNVEAELHTLQETYNKKQETWDTDKKNLQDKIKEHLKEIKKQNAVSETWQLEKARLNAINDEKNSKLEQLKKDNQSQLEQIDHMHKEIEDYRKQFEDYEKVSKVQRNISADTLALDREIKELKNKLFLEEKSRKTEVATMKMRYDNRVAIITEELSNVQGQVSKFKKERDTFRHMLETAQRTIADLKSSGKTSSRPNSDEADYLRNQIGSLEQQISCMEDEVSEVRLENSRLKTELVSEKSAWEVKQSELMSKLNEMEEERILNSGRTKVAGLKSRLELAWTKEREDQHRLLQETSTLARDLRQTLFEVERERDKERLEAKRRIEQLKKSTEEEQDENRKKLNEVQCDLLELRDAHAKLRTTNEKLRREKDRAEKEKDAVKSANIARRRADQEENHKVTALLQLVDELMCLAPELFPNRPGNSGITLPTPPIRRKGPKSRESSPNLDRQETSQEPSPAAEKSQQLHITLQRLTEATDELRRAQRLGEEERERSRKLFAARRAQSTESDAGSDIQIGNGNGKKGRLFRKSLSLEQTSAIAAAQEQIWKDDNEGSVTSFQSYDDSIDTKFQILQRRDPSLDSRLSGGSTQSEVIPSNLEKKKKKGFFGKLKKLTKTSRSMDEDGNGYVLGSGSQLDPGSDTSINSAVIDHDIRSSKKDLKDRLTGMFKKSGSTSRGNSLDRNQKPPTSSDIVNIQDGESIQRPPSSLFRTSPSPVRNDISQSSMSRPLGASTIPPTQKKPPGSAPLLRKVMKR